MDVQVLLPAQLGGYGTSCLHLIVLCSSSCFNQHKELQFHRFPSSLWKLTLKYSGRCRLANKYGSSVTRLLLCTLISFNEYTVPLSHSMEFRWPGNNNASCWPQANSVLHFLLKRKWWNNKPPLKASASNDAMKLLWSVNSSRDFNPAKLPLLIDVRPQLWR